MDRDLESIVQSAKKLITLLFLGSILLQTGCSREKTAAFKTKDAAAKACYEYLREVIEKQGDYEVAFRWFPSKQKAEDFCLGRIQGTL